MLRLTITFASAILAAYPTLSEPVRHYGEGDGRRFEYTSELRDNGFIRIKGKLLDNREPFRLDVAPDGWVHGRFGDWPVSYRVERAVRNRVAAELGEQPAAIAETAAATPR